MRVGLVVGVALIALACIGVAAADEPPLADAGLDQDASVNATVYLDAGGSTNPDGAIDGYEWDIEAPDGSSVSPDCEDCVKTWFAPRQTGEYDVTVRVTDGSRETERDTLIVRVGQVQSEQIQNNSPVTSHSNVDVGPSRDAPNQGRGNGGSGTPRRGYIHQGENGEIFLTGSIDGFRYSTLEGQIIIGTSRFNDLRRADGTVGWNDVSHLFYSHGLTKDDLKDSISDETCKSTRSSGCSTSANEEGTLSDGVTIDNDVPQSSTRGPSSEQSTSETGQSFSTLSKIEDISDAATALGDSPVGNSKSSRKISETTGAIGSAALGPLDSVVDPPDTSDDSYGPVNPGNISIDIDITGSDGNQIN